MHFDAVAQEDEFCSEFVVLNFLYCAGSRHLFDERTIVDFFLKRLNIFFLHFCKITQNFFLRWQNIVRLVSSKHSNCEIGIGHQGEKLIHQFNGVCWHCMGHHVILYFYARTGFLVDEIAYVFIHIVCTVHLVAMQVGFLQL